MKSKSPSSKVARILLVIGGALLLLGAACPPIVIQFPDPSPSPPPEVEVSPEPSHTPPPSPPPSSPSPTPSARPSPIVTPTPPPPPPPPPPCEAKKKPRDRQCELCSERLAGDVQAGHATYDPALKLWWNDRPGVGRQYFNKDCHLVRADGSIIRENFWGIWPNGVMCPKCEAAPTPPPPPTPSPGPSSSPGPLPLLTASGNFPLPEIGTCPAHFRDAPFDLHIKLWQRKCGAAGTCIQNTVTVTQRVGKPYLEHTCYTEDGTYSLSNCKGAGEMWRGCQEPQFIDYLSDFPDDPNPGDGIYIVIFGNLPFGRMDKQTCAMGCPPGMTNPVHNFNAHDKAINRPGSTTVKACMADLSHCSQLDYRTDRLP